MDESERLSVFKAQTLNVRDLVQSWAHVNRQINALLLQKNEKAVETQTKLLALIYCALAESTFSKVIHTPHGLELDEIEQIKQETSHGVKAGWIKCAELSIRRVQGGKANYQPNVLRKLSDLIDAYIFDPSLIRNKLAHGQWAIALNRDNTAINAEITAQIRDLTVVELYRRKFSLEQLGKLLEDMIESPKKAHRRDYWVHLTSLEERETEMAEWTMDRKRDQLFKKKSLANRSDHS